MYDAEGEHDGTPCPTCGRTGTIRWHFAEGFDELECPACGYRSDDADLTDLTRAALDVLERDDGDAAPPPRGDALRA